MRMPMQHVTAFSTAAAFAAGCSQPLAWPEHRAEGFEAGDGFLWGYPFPWGYLLEHQKAMGAGGGPPQAIFWEFCLIGLGGGDLRADAGLFALRGAAFESAVLNTAALPPEHRAPAGVRLYRGSGASAFGILATEAANRAREGAALEAHARRWMRLVFLPRVLPRILRAAEQARPRRSPAMRRDNTRRLPVFRSAGSRAFEREDEGTC